MDGFSVQNTDNNRNESTFNLNSFENLQVPSDLSTCRYGGDVYRNVSKLEISLAMIDAGESYQSAIILSALSSVINKFDYKLGENIGHYVALLGKAMGISKEFYDSSADKDKMNLQDPILRDMLNKLNEALQRVDALMNIIDMWNLSEQIARPPILSGEDLKEVHLPYIHCDCMRFYL